MNELPPLGTTRRQFLRHSSAALVGSAVLPEVLAARESGRQDDPLRIALVGCGGRGTGAAVQALSTEGNVRLVAMADAFSDRLEGSLGHIEQNRPGQVDVPAERRFTGFDAYQRAIDLDVDVVILTTPPGFRPQHFEYAVQKRRHVFMEKPVAVDAPGIRRVLAAAERAKEANLKVGVGLQRHHDPQYIETVDRIQQGALGKLILLRCYWNSGGVWTRPRQPDMTEMEYQMRNWYYFNWLCGDHIVEQHIHNIDVCNWIMGATPVEAQGQGGRQVRTGPDSGEIFDHHAVEFTYADGTTMLSQCRHQANVWNSVSEHAHGSEGSSNVGAGRIKSAGGWDWRYEGERPDPYQVEHDRLFAAVRADQAHNEAERGAMATMTAIFGRMATYSGKRLKWEDALASDLALLPDRYDWDGTPPSLPDAQGRYPIPMPGVTEVL